MAVANRAKTVKRKFRLDNTESTVHSASVANLGESHTHHKSSECLV
jgi:hypothetical protein